MIGNQASSHAVRLVANCIIAYNAIILNTIYEKMLKEKLAKRLLKNLPEFPLLPGRI